MNLCPYHCSRLPASLEKGRFLLLVEAKVSAAELINRMTTKGQLEIDKKYWLLTASTELGVEHKVVFLNGGEDTKQWIRSGGESVIASERLVWNYLRETGISVIYRESFSQQWVSDASKKIAVLEEDREKDRSKLTALEDDREKSRYKITALEEDREKLNTKVSKLEDEMDDIRALLQKGLGPRAE